MRFILLISLYCCLNVCFAQKTYIVSFEKKNLNKESKYSSILSIVPIKVTDYTLIKGIPETCPVYAIYVITINPEQKIYNAYLNKEITDEQYRKNLFEQDLDTTLFNKNAKIRNEFYLYVGIEKKSNEKHIIIDANNNLDFSDDELYKFSLDSKKDTSSYRNFEVRNSNGNIIPLTLDPFNSNGVRIFKKDGTPENEEIFELTINTRNYMQGSININDQKIYITELAYNNLISNRINKMQPFFFNCEDSSLNVIRKIGDTLTLADRKIFIKEAKGNNLYIEDLGTDIYSGKIGSVIPVLYSTDLSGKTINLNELMKDKYVFIDFWGSWCGPCIASISKLRTLYNKIKNREDILILGVALEEKEYIDKLKKIIKDNSIEWLNVWSNYSDRKLSTSIHGKLMIDQFPTYMIIDKEGKIVYKKDSMYNTQNAIDYLLEISK
jgi:thiol-disulfide isomerase/thioredoxin